MSWKTTRQNSVSNKKKKNSKNSSNWSYLHARAIQKKNRVTGYCICLTDNLTLCNYLFIRTVWIEIIRSWNSILFNSSILGKELKYVFGAQVSRWGLLTFMLIRPKAKSSWRQFKLTTSFVLFFSMYCDHFEFRRKLGNFIM